MRRLISVYNIFSFFYSSRIFDRFQGNQEYAAEIEAMREKNERERQDAIDKALDELRAKHKEEMLELERGHVEQISSAASKFESTIKALQDQHAADMAAKKGCACM